MTSWIVPLQATTLCLALLWLGLALLRRDKPVLLLVWAVFCGSIALLQAKHLAGPHWATWQLLFGLGACATCNGFWLVARGLFRPGRPFGAGHLAYAGLIAALIVALQLLGPAEASAAAWHAPLRASLGRVLDLTSSAALVLAFVEGLRGLRASGGGERRLRLVFLASYGSCVALSSLAPVLAASGALAAPAVPLVHAAAALAILLVAQALIHWRLQHPLVAPVTAATVPSCEAANQGHETHAALPTPPAHDGAAAVEVREASASDDDRALAQQLERHMQDARPWLDAQLKLGDLAQALAVGEYRVSRAIHALGHRNVAQYVNAYRVRQACALLQDPASAPWSTLVIGMESGFGSLGAFHRAFRAQLGCTPGAYRDGGAAAACAQPSG